MNNNTHFQEADDFQSFMIVLFSRLVLNNLSKAAISNLESTVVEGWEDSHSRVDVLKFSQQSSIEVGVHVLVDPENIRC